LPSPDHPRREITMRITPKTAVVYYSSTVHELLSGRTVHAY
jgi:hypothetical protein